MLCARTLPPARAAGGRVLRAPTARSAEERLRSTPRRGLLRGCSGGDRLVLFHVHEDPRHRRRREHPDDGYTRDHDDKPQKPEEEEGQGEGGVRGAVDHSMQVFVKTLGAGAGTGADMGASAEGADTTLAPPPPPSQPPKQPPTPTPSPTPTTPPPPPPPTPPPPVPTPAAPAPAPAQRQRRASANDDRACASWGGDNDNHDDRLNVHHIPLWPGPWSRSEECRENAMGDPLG